MSSLYGRGYVTDEQAISNDFKGSILERESEVQALRESHALQVTDIRADHQSEVERIERAHAKVIDYARAEHQATIDRRVSQKRRCETIRLAGPESGCALPRCTLHHLDPPLLCHYRRSANGAGGPCVVAKT